MTYFPDVTELVRPTVGQWPATRKSVFGEQATFGDAGRHKQWLTFGWLDKAHPIPTGECADQDIQTLELAAQNRGDQSRGFHACPFCPPLIGMKIGTDYEFQSGETRKLGSACLEVRDPQGRVWKAPDLVLHYVREHGYAPPLELL